MPEEVGNSMQEHQLVDIRKSSLASVLAEINLIEKEILQNIHNKGLYVTGALAYIYTYGYPRLPRDLDHWIPSATLETYFDLLKKLSTIFGRIILVRNASSEVPTKRGIFLSATGEIRKRKIRFDVITPERFVGGLPYKVVEIPELGIGGAVCDVKDGTFLKSKEMKLKEGAHVSLLDVLDVWYFYGREIAFKLLERLPAHILQELANSYDEARMYTPKENLWALEEIYNACRRAKKH